ncbi:hypothetical protein [Flavisolibacter nicotianae]|uniref:hypothetical protein n=1 Tax=Flavisolibacter nicotianae TaxID=2364882 RepID=UPI000EAC4342|nr:hypothetical protein [Flavisolibacter nicotianae]
MENFTAVYIPAPNNKGYTAILAEYPSIIAEAETKEEAKRILEDNLHLVLQYRRKQTLERYSNAQTEVLACY